MFVTADYFFDPGAEFKRYELHNNNTHDSGYRTFLNLLFKPVSQRIQPCSKGLDFGSGPTPLLQSMFEDAGHMVSIYDPFYAPGQAVFRKQYDFITGSEVLEHLHHPRQELDRLWTCLKPGGVLGIMTALLEEDQDFATWYYARDPTHVIFFSSRTMAWLADYWRCAYTIIGKNVIIFKKQPV